MADAGAAPVIIFHGTVKAWRQARSPSERRRTRWIDLQHWLESHFTTQVGDPRWATSILFLLKRALRPLGRGCRSGRLCHLERTIWLEHLAAREREGQRVPIGIHAVDHRSVVSKRFMSASPRNGCTFENANPFPWFRGRERVSA